MDARFVDPVTHDILINSNTHFPERVSNDRKEQIFLHESMFNSLLFAQNDRAPLVISDPDMTKFVIQNVPQISEYFGKDVELNVTMKLVENGAE